MDRQSDDVSGIKVPLVKIITAFATIVAVAIVPLAMAWGSQSTKLEAVTQRQTAIEQDQKDFKSDVGNKLDKIYEILINSKR